LYISSFTGQASASTRMRGGVLGDVWGKVLGKVGGGFIAPALAGRAGRITPP
jgi:hypothetical protein